MAMMAKEDGKTERGGREETVNTLPSESRGTSLRRRQLRRKEGSHAGILRENEGKALG